MTSLAEAPPEDDVEAIIGLLEVAAAAYERPDVAEHVVQLRLHLTETGLRVLVIGDFKQGKSTFVNALLGQPICPIDEVATSSLPMVIRGGGDTDLIEREDGETSIEVRVPRWLLTAGFVLVDSPGTGGVAATGTAALANLPWADVVIFVTSATRELTAHELELLQAIDAACPRIVIAVTRTDLVPRWRQIVELDRGHLERAGIRAELIPVSAPLRMAALATNDLDLNARSGFPTVAHYLRTSVGTGESSRRTDLAVHEMRWLVDQLAAPFLAEQEAMAGSPAVSRTAIDDARVKAARWTQTLGDGFTDISSTADYELRGRIRTIMQAADARIEETDPHDTWDELVSTVTAEALSTVAEHHQRLSERVEELAVKVSAHFDDESAAVARLAAKVELPQEWVKPPAEKRKLGSAALTMLRGGYGGVAMFGMLGSMAGLTMAMPVVLAAGFFMGRRALADERQRSLGARKQQAKAAVRRYLDDVSVDVNKETRDSLREAQRQLRDAAAARHEAFLESLAVTAAAAARAAETDVQERRRRLADIQAELERLGMVRARIDGLVA